MLQFFLDRIEHFGSANSIDPNFCTKTIHTIVNAQPSTFTILRQYKEFLEKKYQISATTLTTKQQILEENFRKILSFYESPSIKIRNDINQYLDQFVAKLPYTQKNYTLAQARALFRQEKLLLANKRKGKIYIALKNNDIAQLAAFEYATLCYKLHGKALDIDLINEKTQEKLTEYYEMVTENDFHFFIKTLRADGEVDKAYKTRNKSGTNATPPLRSSSFKRAKPSMERKPSNVILGAKNPLPAQNTPAPMQQVHNAFLEDPTTLLDDPNTVLDEIPESLLSEITEAEILHEYNGDMDDFVNSCLEQLSFQDSDASNSVNPEITTEESMTESQDSSHDSSSITFETSSMEETSNTALEANKIEKEPTVTQENWRYSFSIVEMNKFIAKSFKPPSNDMPNSPISSTTTTTTTSNRVLPSPQLTPAYTLSQQQSAGISVAARVQAIEEIAQSQAPSTVQRKLQPQYTKMN